VCAVHDKYHISFGNRHAVSDVQNPICTGWNIWRRFGARLGTTKDSDAPDIGDRREPDISLRMHFWLAFGGRLGRAERVAAHGTARILV
jgi:hypothetical protein